MKGLPLPLPAGVTGRMPLPEWRETFCANLQMKDTRSEWPKEAEEEVVVVAEVDLRADSGPVMKIRTLIAPVGPQQKPERSAYATRSLARKKMKRGRSMWTSTAISLWFYLQKPLLHLLHTKRRSRPDSRRSWRLSEQVAVLTEELVQLQLLVLVLVLVS